MRLNLAQILGSAGWQTGSRTHSASCRMLVARGKVRCRIFGLTKPNTMIKAIFFDAVGTLFYLTKTVGDHYAFVAEEVGLKLNAKKLDAAFYSAWKQMPPRQAIDGPRENDDKDWWRELTGVVLEEAAPTLDELDRDNFFEVAYEHFAEAGVWELYPEVVDVLEQLRPRFELAIVSNFDGRLRVILERLGISKYFRHVFVSSEIGADKPDPEIFCRALKFLDLQPGHVLHVGDDPERDWTAATDAGLSIFQLDRKKNSMRDLILLL
jgi:putative hydrolase of the HAD superfamily